MTKVSNPVPKPEAKRRGRPPAAQQGDVDTRLLDAATHLFVTRGFEATHCDDIARLAEAGKASLYVRFASKGEVFAAVVRRHADRTRIPDSTDREAPLVERLRSAGRDIVEYAVTPAVVEMLRIVIAKTAGAPELALLASRFGSQAAAERVVLSLVAGQPDDLLPMDNARLCADRFVDLVFLPYQMRALLGESAEALLPTAPQRIEETIALLASAGMLHR
ncbi:TetR/AcrR family transcriptional regulator [Robbsia sp. Bb-Pol-6]|uniref:TetR/AcrR family transcriptional regulator n=1 Tax=Robbsia betulipollinis TaxID=2981849 RepID=A0ABT3ZKH5_9BURK|nr:TetR/AcrR family transcriptional regulator [Robbsia betulipollinis]MCY0387034.1 TetR/AcrR family transcriptional regulator [Robbsia betulipollinis]